MEALGLSHLLLTPITTFFICCWCVSLFVGTFKFTPIFEPLDWIGNWLVHVSSYKSCRLSFHHALIMAKSVRLTFLFAILTCEWWTHLWLNSLTSSLYCMWAISNSTHNFFSPLDWIEECLYDELFVNHTYDDFMLCLLLWVMCFIGHQCYFF